MAFKKLYVPTTIKQLFKKQDKVNFDLTIQRGYVWDLEHKSLFIHSIIYTYPFPPCYAEDRGDDIYYMLDGKQRLSTVFDFINNKFALDENTPNVHGIKIAKMFFKDLPENFQDEIFGTNFMIYQFRGMTEEERDEMFYRLNHGVALNTIELTSALAQGKAMAIVNNICETDFMKNKINITDNARNRYGDKEIALQILTIIDKEETGFSSKELRTTALRLKEEGIPDHKLATINKTLQYLSEAFPGEEKSLKKVNIPMVFMLAIKAQEDQIPALQFGGYIQKFFADRVKDSGYSVYSGSGSAKQNNVVKRLNIIREDYGKHIYNSPIYIREQPKEPSTRGRKKQVDVSVVKQAETITEAILETNSNFPSMSNQIKQEQMVLVEDVLDVIENIQ